MMEEAKQKPTANPTPLVVNVPKSTSTGPVATTPTTGRSSVFNSQLGEMLYRNFGSIERVKLTDIV